MKVVYKKTKKREREEENNRQTEVQRGQIDPTNTRQRGQIDCRNRRYSNKITIEYDTMK